MILDTIAMVIGYIVIAGFGIIFLVMVFAVIARHISEQNTRIYEKEFRDRGLDPHIEKRL